jgi:type III pantothenate kinase
MKKNTQEFLLVDAGNSRIKLATACLRGPISLVEDKPTKAATTVWIKALSRRFPTHRLVLACVVPKLVPAFRRAFAKRMEVLSGKSPALGLDFDYPEPNELGADRIAAAVAAHASKQYPAIIIACGTATAFTVLDTKGRLCGGAIAPGLQVQLAALVGAAALLRETTLRMPTTALARSTKDAIRAGVMLNFRGGAKEILRELTRTLPPQPKPHIILTGGNAHFLAKELGTAAKVRPLLIFEGLHIIGNRLLRTTS